MKIEKYKMHACPYIKHNIYIYKKEKWKHFCSFCEGEKTKYCFESFNMPFFFLGYTYIVI